MYFAKLRPMVVRGDTLIPVEQDFLLLPGEKPRDGDVPHALARLQPVHRRDPLRRRHVPKIIEEMMLVRRSERENRVIDHDQEGSMEIKKREGYF